MVRKMVIVGVLVCMVSRGAWAAAKDSNPWSDAGFGFVAVIANVLYMPAKVVYAVVGTLTGSLAYICTVGDADVANRVWSPSLGGSYVISPAMIRGDEPILFNGPSYASD